MLFKKSVFFLSFFIKIIYKSMCVCIYIYIYIFSEISMNLSSSVSFLEKKNNLYSHGRDL